MKHDFQVVIIGGGIVGLSLAALLAKQQFSVAVVESKPFYFSEKKLTARVSAIHLSSVQLLKYFGVWDTIEKEATPLQEMKIWDHIQNAHLHFDSRMIDADEMGWIVDNQHLIQTLHDMLQKDAHVTFFSPHKPIKQEENNHRVTLHLDHNITLHADLIVGADGAHSWVRQQMPIKLNTRDYLQKAIIAVIQSEKPHNDCAYQKFLTTGPVALLPLKNNHQTALVWSADTLVSDDLMQQSDTAFSEALTQALDYKLGVLKTISPREQFGLMMRHAEDYVSSHCVLVGDAAHTIHPLAGLGVNLGLMDAACLSEVLCGTRDQHRPLYDQQALRRYSRWRKAENTDIILAMQGLKDVFAIDEAAFNTLRSFGMNAIDQSNCLKTYLMRLAVGQSGTLPNFLQRNWFTETRGKYEQIYPFCNLRS